MKRIRSTLSALVLLVVGFQFVGCDAIESINPFNNEKEVTGTVETVDTSTVTVDGIGYAVTDKTEFDGYADLSEVQVGDKVEIDYEEKSGNREAVEIEKV